MASTADQKLFPTLLSKFLALSDYSPEANKQYVEFFTTHFLPHLIPPPTWIPNLTHNASPFEPSRNITTGTSLVRYCVELMSPHSGTLIDPFNERTTMEVVKALPLPGLYREWWDLFAPEFCITDPADVEHLLTLPENEAAPFCYLALDLLNKESFEMVLKAYLYPYRLAILEKISTNKVILDIIKKLDEVGGENDLWPAVAKVEKFVNEGRDAGYEGIRDMLLGNIDKITGLVGVMLTIDCIDSPKARIKYYVQTYDTSFANLIEVYTLASQIPVSDAELKSMRAIYSAVYDLPEGWDGVTELPPTKKTRGTAIVWGFEFSRHEQLPDMKFYLPVWAASPHDAESKRRLARFFATQGWDVAETYSDEFDELFGTNNLDVHEARHTYISFAYTEKRGAYVTIYYNPKLEGQQGGASIVR